ncbi:DUF6503 family protein [Neolewinella lacunae]|uniref:DUF2911 domain-containing protein n=1 Tax=Neolewinella lacunae TaxID=1517758 RepID=A0A923PL07_9BACT|nr:DUF6503 family protein [Neolewinella lacunae]MBC6993229.1 DUF2911 domain-containing protein [Neolewinella lacunae]MDN3635724.1 DUF6503 family protein [Neolewinella lacunae]
MKSLLTLLLSLPLWLSAQFVAPSSSPPAETSTEAGYTQLSVSYHRPNVRGRVIFGELLPWGEVWRAGANENTLLKADGEFRVGDSTFRAGTYSLYLIPRRSGDWTWVLNRSTQNWGTQGYQDSKDVLRIPARPIRLPERIETLEYRWMNVRPQSVDLVLEWEWYRVSLTISLPTDEQVADRAASFLNPAQDPKEYYAAARYYLDNKLNLQKAKAWMDRWAAQDEEQFGRLRYQALIEYQLGNEAKGKRLMERSLELAKAAKNTHYIRMNEESLREWSRTPESISPDSLLARSIRYHDPEKQWTAKAHLLQLAESRTDGTVRHTRLSLYPATADFDLYQVRGKDKVQLRFLNGTYSFSHQGRTDISDSTRASLHLDEARTLLLRDYYTYLWGLPMKLEDPGTLLQPTVHRVWYDGREMLEMEVHYTPETGKDIWFFLFDPVTYALAGYRFYHAKDGPGTGEYILLEGEATVNQMKLPARRHWYSTADRLYLGTDEILE